MCYQRFTMADPPSNEPRTEFNPYDYLYERRAAKIKENPALEVPGCKIFNDPVHGHIQIHPLCVKIIDTPQFQRLRYLKQLGNAYYVYPGGSHNRFEHSIGVCYLAGQFIRVINMKQPELEITQSDILCVEIAGLCHDLGHGPFSHFFDQKFLPKVRPKEKWTHEAASVKMLKFLVDDNKLWPEFEKFGLTEGDFKFINEQILGNEPRTGRPQGKCFLYEIVSNKINGIDVDKWDYFARDCLMLGIKNSFDHVRLMRFARVLKVDGKLQICFRDKEVWDLYGMFHTRYSLHLRACQHIVVRGIDDMLGEALIEANNYLKFPGKDGKEFKMSEAIDDMEAYMKMNDYSVFFMILHSTKKELEKSRKLLRRIEKRQLYKFVGQTQLKGEKIKDPTKSGLEENREERQKQIKKDLLEQLEPSVSSEEIGAAVFVEIATLNYGKRDQNPIDSVRFYTKLEPDMPIQLTGDQVSQLLPLRVQEEQIRIYSKTNNEPTMEILKEAMRKWCEKEQYPQPIRM